MTERFSRVDIQKALAKVGRRKRDWLAWVLRFAQLDLTGCTSPDLENLRLELSCFTLPEYLRDIQVEIPGNSIVLVPPDSVAEMQKRVRTILDSFGHNRAAAEHNPRLGPAGLSLSFDRVFVEVNETGLHVVPPRTNDASGVVFALASAMAGELERIKRCDNCKRWYLAKRTDSRFCPEGCASIVTSRRYRASKKERKRK